MLRPQSPKTRVLLVASDPALRGGLRQHLDAQADLMVVTAVATQDEALEQDAAGFDSALIDLDSAGPRSSAMRLGLELKARCATLGIVILTDQPVGDPFPLLPEPARMGWSYLDKAQDFDEHHLAQAIVATSWGLNVRDAGIQERRPDDGAPNLTDLTDRQREVIALASRGLDVASIGARLGMTAATTRQELSRVYAVLVPDPDDGTDLRTLAVLRYLRITEPSTRT